MQIIQTMLTENYQTTMDMPLFQKEGKNHEKGHAIIQWLTENGLHHIHKENIF